MHRDILDALAAGEGVMHRPGPRVPRHAIARAHHAGTLLRLQPGTYALGTDRSTRWKAALAYLGPAAALSHPTALSVWSVRDEPPDAPIHASVPSRTRRKGAADLIVHRRTRLDPIVRHGLCVTRLEQSIVDSWPLLDPAHRRDPIIAAVAGRRTTVPRMRAALHAHTASSSCATPTTASRPNPKRYAQRYAASSQRGGADVHTPQDPVDRSYPLKKLSVRCSGEPCDPSANHGCPGSSPTAASPWRSSSRSPSSSVSRFALTESPM